MAALLLTLIFASIVEIQCAAANPELSINRYLQSAEPTAVDSEVAPLCADKRCRCRKSDGREDNASSGDDDASRGSHARDGHHRLQSYVTATCTADVINESFDRLLANSTAVRSLVLVPPLPKREVGTGWRKGQHSERRSDPMAPLTLPWKATVRKPPLPSLDLSSVQLSCDCKNAWLAFWPHSFSEPLVRAEVLRFLAARHRRRALTNTKFSGYKYLHIINEEPSCPYNCSLTVAELFHLPKRIVLGLDDSATTPRLQLFNESVSPNFSDYRGPLAHCLPPGESDLRAHFAKKCALVRLALDAEKVIQNETQHLSITCSRYPMMASKILMNSASPSCPFLKLAPFMSPTYSNDTGSYGYGLDSNSTTDEVQKRRRPFVTRCISKDVTIGEKDAASRNESGWLLCQEPNAYLPQAALAPFIIAGSPQIMHFYVDHLAEQVHIAFYVVGYPRPQFGWHNYDPDDKWLKPNITKKPGFEVILTSKPSFGHYIIYGRATFSELSMNCFKGRYDFVVCNSYGCDKRAFHIPQGMPALMCPPPSQQSNVGLLDPVHSDQSALGVSANFSGGHSLNGSYQPGSHAADMTIRPYLSFPAPTTLPSSFGRERENWIYIAVPFLVVFAVVLVGVLTTCLFLRLIGGGAGSRNSSTRKLSSSRYKSRPSLTDWELSPLNQPQLHPFEVNSSYVDWLHNIKAHVRVFAAGELSIIKELGEGAFGRVFLAKVTLAPDVADAGVKSSSKTSKESGHQQSPSDAFSTDSGEELYYAVKLLKNVTAEKLEDLEREAAIMSQLDHPNIVQFFGLSCKSGSLALLFEYMEHGDLVNYLRNHSPETEGCQLPLQWNDLLIIATQIAKGLEYLAERHLVHRDLAARNCLVGKDMTVKISDFGMTRDIYITDYYKMGSRTLVPLRWLPPESILYRKFTVESDIWSFGVLLWEIFSYGKIPWYVHSNCEVLQIIQEGKLLERPDGSPEEVYDYVMLKCWAKQPSERMTAKAARKKLEELVEARLRYCNVLPSYSDVALSAVEVSTV